MNSGSTSTFSNARKCRFSACTAATFAINESLHRWLGFFVHALACLFIAGFFDDIVQFSLYAWCIKRRLKTSSVTSYATWLVLRSFNFLITDYIHTVKILAKTGVKFLTFTMPNTDGRCSLRAATNINLQDESIAMKQQFTGAFPYKRAGWPIYEAIHTIRSLNAGLIKLSIASPLSLWSFS